MAALRIVFLVLAAGVLSLLGWRTVAGRTAPDATAQRPALTQPAPEASLLPSNPTARTASLERAMRSPPGPILASLPASAPIAAPAPAPPPTPTPAAPTPAALTPAPAPAPSLAALRPAPAFAEVPEFLAFFGRLRADFPHSAAKLPARADGPDAAVWDALRDLEQSDGVLAAQADAAALDRFFDARSAVLAGLAPLDARRCVDFLYGMTDAGIADFTASHRALVATLADRTLDAIADGRGRHIERPAPTEADLDALSAKLAAFGLGPAEVGLLIDGTTPDPPLGDGRTCEIGRTYLDVLHGLPPDVRARVYGLAAQLLARS